MTTVPAVSIIICTCNRSLDLERTLAALMTVEVPADLPTELIVVDNASTDDTARVLREARLPHLPLRALHEPRPGQSLARNTALAAARGDVILFTDDDVRPPRDWVGAMCAPILAGRAAAVAGGVRLAPHLLRPWMEPEHRGCLANTERLDPVHPAEMVGANMAFSRDVLARVPGFDPALGPGALGYGDDTLFGRQILQAGMRLVGALDVAVEHHFDPSRLRRASFLGAMKKAGRSQAYVKHHWEHDPLPDAHYQLAKHTALLAWSRLRRRAECRPSEGCPVWEMQRLRSIALYTHFLRERTRPRRYATRGLRPSEVPVAEITGRKPCASPS